jgi:hypothetical protein
LLASCSPEESPEFVHGRPRSLNYDLVFTKKPHRKGGSKDESLTTLAPYVTVKMEMINMKDGTKSKVSLPAAKLYYNEKHYLTESSEEHHVSAVFDLEEY